MDKIVQKIIEHIIEVPLFMFTLFFSFLSGNVWVFIVFSYFISEETAKKEWAKFLHSKIGRVALGLLWFTATTLIVYLINFRDDNILEVTYDNVVHIMPSVILFSLVAQLLLFIIINLIFKRLARKGGHS